MNRELFEKKRLILASGSPRRREIMEKLHIPFEVIVSEADETIPEEMPIESVSEYLSAVKADAVYKLHHEDGVIIVGADTIVVYDGIIYGKPRDEEDAYRMLKTLSGNTHKVITGVSIIVQNGEDKQEVSFSNVSRVSFYEFSDREIWDYIATGEPMDKAGAYGIQQQGALLVKHIDGDFYSVMGLPIAELARAMEKQIYSKAAQ